MSPLENKILELLPLLSEEAKNRARFILGNKVVKKRKRLPIVDDAKINLMIMKSMKLTKKQE